MFEKSETVNLDVLLVDTQLLTNEVENLATLIALQLNNFAEILILYNGTIGSEILLESSQNTFRIIFLGKSLDSGQCLTTVTLLDSNMYIVLRLVVIPSSICERIESLEIFDGHKLLCFSGCPFKGVLLSLKGGV